MKIFLASDHAGFELKEEIKDFLKGEQYEVVDCGPESLNPEDDYPDFVEKAAGEVSKDPESLGIIFGKSGQGEAICANKIRGIRAAIGFNEEITKLAREHNNANILSLGSVFADGEKAKQLIRIFLKTPFSNEERHARRIQKISKLENEYV